MNLSVVRVIWHICTLYLLAPKGSLGFVNQNLNRYEPATTRFIDLSNPIDEKLLKQFNVSVEDLRARQFPPTSTESSTVAENVDPLAHIKELRLFDIKNRIQNAISGNGMNNEYPTHEMAIFPSCTASVINETLWTGVNNLTIRFGSSHFEPGHPYVHLDSAILRLYKLNPDPTSKIQEPDCKDLPTEPQIRVTISTIIRSKKNKKERKKRICNNVMLDISQTGWVEIDIKKAISIWVKAVRQEKLEAASDEYAHANNSNNNRQTVEVGVLIIEVHDEDEKQLKPGLYFSPPKCSESRQSPGISTDNSDLPFLEQMVWKKCPEHQD